jgi:hypothetical protein
MRGFSTGGQKPPPDKTPQKKANTTTIRNNNREKYKKLKWAVRQKFNHRCFITNETTNLVLHHLNGFEWDVEGRYDPANCVLIHEKIHYMFHGIYKCRANTRQQFEAFLKIYYPEAPIPWIDEQFQLGMTLEDAIILINKHRHFFYTELEQLATSRNHFILNGQYENTNSEFEMKCLNHNVFFTIRLKH